MVEGNILVVTLGNAGIGVEDAFTEENTWLRPRSSRNMCHAAKAIHSSNLAERVRFRNGDIKFPLLGPGILPLACGEV